MRITKKYNRFIRDVLDKRILVCDAVKQAVKRHVKDLERKDWEYKFDEKVCDKIIAFIETLELYEGKLAGHKIVLDDWQAFIVASIFGWVKKSDNKRRFKKAFISVGRGNGKTPLMAALSLIALLRDNGAQVYSMATNYSQAALALHWVKNFVRRNPELSELIECYDKSVFFKQKYSTFRALSKSFKGFDGFNPSFVIADEIAAMQDYELLSVMETALMKREESLLCMITTANTASSASPGLVEYEYSKKILTGEIKDDRYFAIIFELDKSDDWIDERNYKKANPATWLNMQELREARDEALQNKLKEKPFRTKNLNTWNLGANNSWIDKSIWLKNNVDKIAFDKIELRGLYCAIGADFSDRRDLSCYTLAFIHGSKVVLKHKVYVPADTIKKRERAEAALLTQWIDEGYVKTCIGEYIDKDMIAGDILDDIQLYRPFAMAYDPYSSYEIIEQLKTKIELIPVPQDMRTMSPYTYDFEELVKSNKIINCNPVMDWCIDNCTIYESNKLIKVAKVNKDSPKRIDLVISSILACAKLKEVAGKKQPARDVSKLKKLLSS